MNRYFFTPKNDKSFNRVGLTYAPNRKVAAQLFCIRKGLKIKEFLEIYSVFNCSKLEIGKSVKISKDSESAQYSFNPTAKTYSVCEKNQFHNLKNKYSLNTFLQLTNYLQKEDYKIYQD